MIELNQIKPMNYQIILLFIGLVLFCLDFKGKDCKNRRHIYIGMCDSVNCVT